MQPADLLSAAAVRTAARRMLAEAEAGELLHWELRLERLPAIADRVAAVTLAAYPDLVVPFHARWRHFEAGGRDRWRAAASSAQWPDARTKARAAFDLAIVSVLLDAGSGGRWGWREPATGTVFRSSEGLGLASLYMFACGMLSAEPGDPCRADAASLEGFSASALEDAFQVTAENPLAGTAGRAGLLNRLGAACRARPDLFSREDAPRPGGLADVVHDRAKGGAIAAPAVLQLVLEALGPIWPSRLSIDGVALGDAWLYRRWRSAGSRDVEAVVPFHKLSQWLTYSLIEPILEMGLEVTNIDGLTGLAEYRNGGLFVDGGALALRNPDEGTLVHPAASPLVVEWRALTVALLDRLHPLVAAKLGTIPGRFPLACLLEGGSWAAGRLVAGEKRPGGGPPILVESDGTIF